MSYNLKSATSDADAPLFRLDNLHPTAGVGAAIGLCVAGARTAFAGHRGHIPQAPRAWYRLRTEEPAAAPEED